MDIWLEFDLGGLQLEVLAKLSPDGECVDALKVISIDYPRNLNIEAISYKGKELWDLLSEAAIIKTVEDIKKDKEAYAEMREG